VDKLAAWGIQITQNTTGRIEIKYDGVLKYSIDGCREDRISATKGAEKRETATEARKFLRSWANVMS
jgi:hypothetical protein